MRSQTTQLTLNNRFKTLSAMKMNLCACLRQLKDTVTLSRDLTMYHMVRAVPRMATMRAASLKAQTIMAARVAPTIITPARV